MASILCRNCGGDIGGHNLRRRCPAKLKGPHEQGTPPVGTYELWEYDVNGEYLGSRLDSYNNFASAHQALMAGKRRGWRIMLVQQGDVNGKDAREVKPT